MSERKKTENDRYTFHFSNANSRNRNVRYSDCETRRFVTAKYFKCSSLLLPF